MKNVFNSYIIPILELIILDNFCIGLLKKDSLKNL